MCKYYMWIAVPLPFLLVFLLIAIELFEPKSVRDFNKTRRYGKEWVQFPPWKPTPVEQIIIWVGDKLRMAGPVVSWIVLFGSTFLLIYVGGTWCKPPLP